jgi:hypothetical protein
MSEQTPEVPESGLPAEAEQVAAEALAPVEQAAPEAVASVEEAAPEAAPEAAAAAEEAVAAAPAAADVPPPPAFAAPAAATVPVFPNGKPMLDAQGQPVSDKSRLAAALLCWFVGVLGVHRFYVGKVGTGVAMLLTCGGLGVWALIDLIVILLGSFKDQDGRALQNW